MLTPADFFDLSQYAHRALFEDARVEYVWDVLKLLREYLDSVICPEIRGEVMSGAYITGDRIFIGAGSVVEPGALIKGPAYIGRNTQVRHGAYVRERVLVGDHCVVGHATEIKDTILLDHAHAAHFAYLGDSIVGNHTNLGAGTRLANLKLDGSTIKVRLADAVHDTGMRKLGAVLGDRVQTGCNTVTNPGTLLEPDCRAYALTSPRGFYPRGTIIRTSARLETSRLQELGGDSVPAPGGGSRGGV
jgi:NDP-sugar pyrophosphorylase family protein